MQLHGLMVLFRILGSLTLFLYGLQRMTDGLGTVAGGRLRRLSTQSETAGFAIGSLLGISIQSSAATVMLVGFINAGLMTLAQSIPLMLGANFGTTLAMQLISLRPGDYSYVAIAAGFLIHRTAKRSKVAALGTALMGFGLLFLGISLMSDTIVPYRYALAAYLSYIDGATWSGMVLGVCMATAVTAIIQSSGATIAMTFAMISAGVITQLSEAYPIILGANVGTCITALLGSIGANAEARRAAVAHLVFNLYSCVVGMLTAALFYRYMPALSGNLLTQTAHANSIKMALTALLILPASASFARLVTRLTPSSKQPPEAGHLDETLLAYPEDALVAALSELRRAARLCRASLNLDLRLFQNRDPGHARRVEINETAIDAIKLNMDDYLVKLTHGYLSQRQAILIQHIGRIMSNLERIGDHIDRIRELIEARPKRPAAVFGTEIRAVMMRYFDETSAMLDLVVSSLDPENTDFAAAGHSIVTAREAFGQLSNQLKSRCTDIVASKGVGMPPLTAALIIRYIDAFDRIARHCENIALLERQAQFSIKREKLRHSLGASSPGEARTSVSL